MDAVVTPSQHDAYLRQRALRVVTDTEGDYTMLARTLAIGVLDLLDKRDRAVEMTAEHWHAEMSELRDGLAEVATRYATFDALKVGLALLDGRVDGLARRVDALEA